MKFPAPKPCAYQDVRLKEQYFSSKYCSQGESSGSSGDPLQQAMNKRDPLKGTPGKAKVGDLVPPKEVYPEGVPEALSELQIEMLATSAEMVASLKDSVRLSQLDAVSSQEVPWIKSRGGKTFVEMTIDSGAAATVVPRGAFDTQIVETVRTRNEVFATASGQRMPNYGEQRIRALSTSGTFLNITAQVTDVKSR